MRSLGSLQLFARESLRAWSDVDMQIAYFPEVVAVDDKRYRLLHELGPPEERPTHQIPIVEALPPDNAKAPNRKQKRMHV